MTVEMGSGRIQGVWVTEVPQQGAWQSPSGGLGAKAEAA